MTPSMYHASIPAFIRMMGNLAEVLKKGATHATSRKIDPTVLINSRLFPDMLPLARQVQIASDTAKGCAARLAGQEPPKFEDNESTFPELLARTDKTVAFLKTFKPGQIDGTEDKTIHLKIGGESLTFKGMPYLLNFVLPNFYFHVTTAYDILRHNGVELGKKDYLGKF
ncbi:MAG: DUF1993 domain-containing protein [Sulfuricaulis sp.]|uniref:DUF1993 family protein n=1 Tax=Sulfuricaulis sp. TaxID=2003553 RepID=UPI0034A3120A